MTKIASAIRLSRQKPRQLLSAEENGNGCKRFQNMQLILEGDYMRESCLVLANLGVPKKSQI